MDRCTNGHYYTPENTYINPAGRRFCRLCKRERSQQQYDRDFRAVTPMGHRVDRREDRRLEREAGR